MKIVKWLVFALIVSSCGDCYGVKVKSHAPTDASAHDAQPCSVAGDQ